MQEFEVNLLAFVQRKVIEIIQTLKLAKKTSKDDYFTHLRLVLLGMAIVGGIAFVIKLIAEFITSTGGKLNLLLDFLQR
jgi:protein transport protein SEC61 subunit gamma-like protein